VRSWVFLIDLKCDDVILKMFHCFVDKIRKYHTNEIKAAMQNILSLILDEDDDISKLLLSNLSSIWRKEQVVSPTTHWLSKTVIEHRIQKIQIQLTEEEAIAHGLQVTRIPMMSKNHMRRQGLCFSCKEFQGPNHQCPVKRDSQIDDGLANEVTFSAQEVVISNDNNSDFYDSSHSFEHSRCLNVMEETSIVGTQDMSLKHERSKKNTSHNSSDLCDSNSSLIHLCHHEATTITHENAGCVESPNEDTQVLSVIDAIGVVDASRNKSDFANQTLEDVNESENLLDGDGSQDSSLVEHASTLEDAVYMDIGKSATSSVSSEPSIEVHNSSTLNEDAYQSVSDEDSASYHSTDFKSKKLCGDNWSVGSKHFTGQLKVNEGMIAATIEHFDIAQQLLENCCWKTLEIQEHFDSELSLAKFQALRDMVMKTNYLQLLLDRDHLLMLDGIYHDALKGKEEEVDELTYELEVTTDP
ncbi:hypothetical protein KI387_018609, partial [Taxus chinensis]